MAIDDISAGSSGVARYAQRPVKNALISNTDNPAVQQYAQVSHFTSFLADAAPAVSQNDSPPDRKPEQQSADSFFASSSASSSSASAPSEPSVSVLNYSSKGSTNPIQNPISQAGKFLSLSV